MLVGGKIFDGAIDVTNKTKEKVKENLKSISVDEIKVRVKPGVETLKQAVDLFTWEIADWCTQRIILYTKTDKNGAVISYVLDSEGWFGYTGVYGSLDALKNDAKNLLTSELEIIDGSQLADTINREREVFVVYSKGTGSGYYSTSRKTLPEILLSAKYSQYSQYVLGQNGELVQITTDKDGVIVPGETRKITCGKPDENDKQDFNNWLNDYETWRKQ